MEPRLECEEFYEVRQLFEDRVKEVDRFINFNVFLANSRANKLASDGAEDEEPNVFQDYIIERDLLKTFRSSAFLLLYNLVESTMTNAVDAIHQSMAFNGYDFPKLTTQMKKVVLKNFKGGIRNISVEDEFLFYEESLKKSMTTFGYDKSFLFSGNICAKTIRDCAAKYGFKIADHDQEKSQAGRRIFNIKEKRDHLAHGKVSFEDCGQEISPDELMSLFVETVTYLRAVLDGVEVFIFEKQYLKEEERV